MSTNSVLMISTQFLKNNTVINENVDDELLEPFIVTAQNIRIERVLGSDLFNNIVSNIENNAVSGINKTILDNYLQPALTQWTLYEALPYILFKLTNKSISKKDSENSVSADLSEMQYLRKNVRDVAEYLDQRFIEFLEEEWNNGNLPLYRGGNSNLDDIRPTTSTYFNGMYLGDGRNDCDFGLGIGIPLN